jgi:hypothetical protein
MEFEERRHCPRAKLDQLAYISLQSGNGGIVLDVSEGGLSFHAAVPMEAEKLIGFRLSVKSAYEIEATGELAWNDETRKSGGLRFIELPDELHEQIRIWLGESRLPVGAGRSPVSAGIQFSTGSVDHSTFHKVSQPLSASRSGSHSRGRDHHVSRPLPVTHTNIGWRTTILVYLVLAALGLGGASLLFVRHAAQNYVQEEIATDARDSLLTAQTALRQNGMTLSRKADLLATLVAMTPTNDSTLQDSIDNPLIAEGSDLVVLTDGANQIVALHTSNQSMTAIAAEGLLLRSVRKGNPADWWYVDGNLYQVALQSVDGSPMAQNRSGTVVVGRQVDYATVQILGDTSGSHVALSYGGEVVASSLNAFDRYELAQKLHDQPTSGQIQIGQQRFYSRSLDLTSGSGPVVRLLVLKSYKEATAFLGELNDLFIRLTEVALMVSFGLVILVASRSRDRLRPFTHKFSRAPEAVLLIVPKWARDKIVHITRGLIESSFPERSGTEATARKSRLPSSYGQEGPAKVNLEAR